MNSTTGKGSNEGRHQHGQEVQITVDGKPLTIADGVYSVVELKAMFGIAPDYELDQVDDGEFKPLNDERSIHIKGGEIFIGHVRQGGSS